MTPKKRGPGWDWLEPDGAVLYRYINKKPSPTGPDGTPWDLPKLASGGGGGSRNYKISSCIFYMFTSQLSHMTPKMTPI